MRMVLFVCFSLFLQTSWAKIVDIESNGTLGSVLADICSESCEIMYEPGLNINGRASFEGPMMLTDAVDSVITSNALRTQWLNESLIYVYRSKPILVLGNSTVSRKEAREYYILKEGVVSVFNKFASYWGFLPIWDRKLHENSGSFHIDLKFEGNNFADDLGLFRLYLDSLDEPYTLDSIQQSKALILRSGY